MDNTEQQFVINRQLQGLNLSSLHTKNSFAEATILTSSISQQSIVDAIRSPNLTSSQQVHSVVNSSLALFKRYKNTLSMLCEQQSDTQAAASSDDVFTRRMGDGFEITLIPDTDNSTQTYLILKVQNVHEQTDSSARFLHVEHNNLFYVMHFENAQHQQNLKTNGVDITFQKLVNVNDNVYLAITDPSSRLYLSAK